MELASTVSRLTSVLPPTDAHWETELESDWLIFRLAAVLVLLFERDSETHLVLTKRPETLSHHPGQISLPGGGIEETDASPWHAAIRETEEEIGIPATSVQPIGRLSPMQIRASNNLVLPFVGWTQHAAPRPIDLMEVEEVIHAPFSLLLEPGTVKEEIRPLRNGHPYVITYFDINGHIVWGATARILSDLISRLSGQEWKYPPGWVRPSPEEHILG